MKIVYGPAADEYTRSHHALALVLGTDIFFRNGDTAFNNSGETSTRSFILSISSFCLRFIKSSYNHISFTFKTCIINDSIIFCPYIHNILPLIFLSKVFMSNTFNGVINCGVPPLNHFIDVSLGLYHFATMASTPTRTCAPRNGSPEQLFLVDFFYESQRNFATGGFRDVFFHSDSVDAEPLLFFSL